MKEELSVALVQNNLIWKNKKANLDSFERLIDSISQPVDVIVLPEMFNTAFCVEDMELAEKASGSTLEWMTQMAKHKNAAVCGSILFQEDKFYNRFLFVEPDGRLSTYDKHHLFSLVGEQHLLSKGDKKIIISYRGWEIQPFICYDLRFPAWCQNDSHADIQLFVASWPSKRIHHWSILLKARAIENQCYTLGVNRVGTDFFSHEHNGHSAAYDMAGNELCNMSDSIGVQIVKLSKENLEKHKKHYPFWKDRDTFALPLE